MELCDLKQSCVIHIYLIRTKVSFIQDVSGAYTSPFLDTDELKMTLWTPKVSEFFKERAPGWDLEGTQTRNFGLFWPCIELLLI